MPVISQEDLFLLNISSFLEVTMFMEVCFHAV